MKSALLALAFLVFTTPTQQQSPGFEFPQNSEEWAFYERTRQSVIASNPYVSQYGYVLNSGPDAMRFVLSEQLKLWREARLSVPEFQ